MPRINGNVIGMGAVVSATAPMPKVLEALNEEVKKYATDRRAFSFEVEAWLKGQTSYGEEYCCCPISDEDYDAEGLGLLSSAVDWLDRSCPPDVSFGRRDGKLGFWYL
jgi:hypothetical protein